MSDAQSWRLVEEGRTLGMGGPEGGTVVRDEEHPAGLRLTLEEDPARSFYAVTCGVAGWLVHSRFFGSEAEALAAWEEMKPALLDLVVQLPPGGARPLVPATLAGGGGAAPAAKTALVCGAGGLQPVRQHARACQRQAGVGAAVPDWSC